MGSPDCKDSKNAMEEVDFWGTWRNPLLGVWGAWMTFKNPEMDKTLKNGVKYDWNESTQPQMVWFCDLVGTGIAPVSTKTAAKKQTNRQRHYLGTLFFLFQTEKNL